MERLSLGCPALDAATQGGLLTRQLTEIAGESGSGKTQLCLQARPRRRRRAVAEAVADSARPRPDRRRAR